MARVAIALLLAALLGVAGCGEAKDPDRAAAEGTSAAASPPSTAPAVTAGPPGAETYREPGGAYEIDVDPGWEEVPIETPKGWAIGTGSADFGDNVNVIVERLREPVPLEEYIELSERNAPRIVDGFEPVSREIVTLDSGERGARWVYRGRPTDRDLAFLAVVGVAPDRAVVVTLTAEPERFDAAAAEAEPYMRTLRLP